MSAQDTGGDCSLDAIAAAWPDGVPDGERLIWAVLNADRRAKAIVRIGALLGYERDGDHVRRLRETGLSRPGFFSMLRRWRADRSLSAVVPGTRALADRRRGEGVPDEVAAALRSTLEDHPDWSKDRVAKEVRGMFGTDAPAATTLRVLMDRYGTEREREALGRDAGFGARVAIVTSPLVLRSTNGAEWRPVAQGGFAVDVATGYVLGAAAAADAEAAFSAAARAAADLVAGLAEAVPGDRRPEFEIHVASNGAAIVARMARLSDLAIVDASDGSAGRTGTYRAVELLGSRMGVLGVAPRTEVPLPTLANERDPRGPAASAAIVGELLAVEVEGKRPSHRSAFPPLAVPAGTLADALRRIAG